ncbi:glycosyltransferase family 4 protein [Actinomycetospora flava]|uniref:glycosyltransferase family 4 protein n=1 Tax=Actinomycetospora flava TaxID=3129232 RepID=UPI00359F4795
MGDEHIRVLAYPAYQSADENPYITDLYEAVRTDGISVDDYTRRGLLRRYNIIHIHWPEQLVEWRRGPFYATADAAKVLALLAAAKAQGTKLVWTGHDLGPHDMPHPRIYRAYVATFMRFVDLLISLDQASIPQLLDRYPRLRKTSLCVIPHSHYRNGYPHPPTRKAARERLRLPGQTRVLLLLGRVKRYKRIDSLIQGYAERGSNGFRLIVVGREAEYDPDYAIEVSRAALNAGPNVEVRLGAVPATEVPTWHAAADVVVLPYARTTALHSGAALLALSLHTPIVVTDTPTMRELAATVGTGWVHLSNGTIDDTLRVAELAADSRPPGPPDLSNLDPGNLGRETAQSYRTLVDGFT